MNFDEYPDWEQLESTIELEDGRKLVELLALFFNLDFTRRQVPITIAKTSEGEYLIFPCADSEVGKRYSGKVMVEPISKEAWQNLVESVRKALNEMLDLEEEIEILRHGEDSAKTVGLANEYRTLREGYEDRLARINDRVSIGGRHSLQSILNFLDVFLPPEVTSTDLERLLYFLKKVLKIYPIVTQEKIEG